MDFADKNEKAAQTIVLYAVLGSIGALALGMGLWPLIICGLCLSPCLAAFNDGLKRNPHNRGGGGGRPNYGRHCHRGPL